MASTDNAVDNKGFAEKNEANFPILSDPEKTMTSDYGVLSGMGFANRWTYYIDTDGIIQMIDKSVDPRVAGEQLVRNLTALGIPRSSPPD
jgi:thioredoxin-dependent peroxiredoxin